MLARQLRWQRRAGRSVVGGGGRRVAQSCRCPPDLELDVVTGGTPGVGGERPSNDATWCRDAPSPLPCRCVACWTTRGGPVNCRCHRPRRTIARWSPSQVVLAASVVLARVGDRMLTAPSTSGVAIGHGGHQGARTADGVRDRVPVNLDHRGGGCARILGSNR